MTKFTASLEQAIKHHQAGRLSQAAALYRKILARDPRCADALHLLGVVAHQTGQSADAVKLIRQAAAITPENPAIHSNLGEAYRHLRMLNEAVACFDTALALQPSYPTALNNLGNALHALGRQREALDSYQRAIALQPNDATIHNNLGNLFKDEGELDLAVSCFERALALKSDFAEARHNLGIVHQLQHRLEEATADFQQALAWKPDDAEFNNSLASILKALGRLDEAFAGYRRALALAPRRADIHSNLILALHYRSGQEQALEAELQRWNSCHAQPLARSIRPHTHERSPERQLRVGYISPDFRLHSVAFFLLPLLQAHDHRVVHITAFTTSPRVDHVTDQLISCVAEWRSLVGVSDEAAAQFIRDNHIDLLVDLSGHTAKNRLPLFARKPAPIQISFLGFPGKTGLQAIDYRLSDRWVEPVDIDPNASSEQLAYLPETAWCFAPLSGRPPVSVLPAARVGYITFGCFNNFAKVTDDLVRLWAKILQSVPHSRLMLKGLALASPTVAQRLRILVQTHGVAPDRLDLRPQTASAFDHLRCYEEVDIALDTFPYHGTTTTCEALWMGVPVVTLAGQTHVSRVGVSLLTNAGLPEFVAITPGSYVEKAVATARDLPALSHLRTNLRHRLQSSPLMDGPRFARAVEAAYRAMWVRWCAGGTQLR